MTAGLPDLSPDNLEHLITGPAAGFLKDLVCRLRELRQKQEINSGIINSAADAIVTINEDHVIVGYQRRGRKDFRLHPEGSPGAGPEHHHPAAL